MTLYNRFLGQLCLSVSIALILCAGFATSAKTRRSANSQATSSETIINLSDFSPAGDGVTDDGPALQSAIDALADAGGGTLLIPAGSYLIATPVIKDFSGSSAANVIIQGVPSLTMPAPPTANGDSLAAGLNLTSELIPATGAQDSAITLTNLHQLTIEHVGFTGRDVQTDAFVTLYLSDIDQATIRHCEFYAISTYGLKPGFGGGNIIRAVRSEMSIELSVVLGCTANSGAYAPIIENVEWRKFSISNSIFLDYGLRTYYGKMGLGAPISWINIANAAAITPESPRREVIVRDTFLDEGGWVGISVNPRLWDPPSAPIDLIYISGLKMNVSNFATAGHFFQDARNLLIENSHYGWSHNTIAAIDINRFENAILDRLTCIADADRIRADAGTGRLTVINSVYGGLDSLAQTTTEINTTPEHDPVQYVRRQFLSVLGKQPDPAAHFYWSDVLIKCGDNDDCLNQQRSALSEYLNKNPQPNFSITGTVVDENGDPLSVATISLTGSQSAVVLTDLQGNFRFAGLPTSGTYTVAVKKQHYSFTTTSETFVVPANNKTVVFHAQLNRHSIEGRITGADGKGVGGVTMELVQSPGITVTTDAHGSYSFEELPAGEDYTVVPLSDDFVFFPGLTTFDDLSADRAANFAGKLRPEILMMEGSETTIALDSVSFLSGPFSIFDSLGFGPDGLTRVMVFVKNLESVAGPSQVSVVAEDDEGNTHPLAVEYAGDVAGQSWLKQINLKLSPNLVSGRCYQLRLTAAGISSNNGRICIAR
jgi:Carboxypeptidase regulatory-like domain/Pectate lyase superfamily protein